MSNVYNVPIIPQNLSKQETIIQVAEVLNHLTRVTEDIFKHINTKVETTKAKLTNISDRVDKVNTKIAKLTGAKNATQVFSSCKYPDAPYLNQPYISIFADVTPLELERHKVKNKKLVLNDESLDKLHVYHVKTKSSDENQKAINGLDEIPTDIECVNDLLLYNSGKNLYKNFVMSDALNQETRGDKHSNDSNSEVESAIGAAPHSITERSTIMRSSTQNYFYSPNLGDVPAINVPLDLPDLPNVADDLRYDTELGPGIAPSVIPNIPDLPSVIDQVDLISDSMEVKLENSLNSLPPPSPPPPSPPPPQVAPRQVAPVAETKSISTPDKPEQPVVTATPQPQVVEAPPQMDMRSSLMDAIRKAGGTKGLKSSGQTFEKLESKIKNVSKVGGGDLMADLHAKLSMRRKGISGAKKENIDAGSTLGKISAMIPAPVPNKDMNETNTEDEDWDD